MIAWVKQFFTDLHELWLDMWIGLFEMATDVFASAVEALPVPEFLDNYSLGSLFAQLPGDVGYFLAGFRLPECFAIIAAGVVFRLLRKLFTLGQW